MTALESELLQNIGLGYLRGLELLSISVFFLGVSSLAA